MNYKDAMAAGMEHGVSPATDIAVSYIEGAPQIDKAFSFYWTAFLDLSTERPQAMNGVVSIPLSAIMGYASYYGLTAAEGDRLIAVIKIVDRWWIAEAQRRQAKETK